MKEFGSLWRLLTPQRRRQLVATLLLMLAGAAAEMVTIGAVFPFLTLAARPESAALPLWLARMLADLGGSALAGAAILLVVAAFAAAAVRVLLSWQSQRVGRVIGTDLASAVFARRLRLPFAEQARRNSSGTLDHLEQVHRVVGYVLLPALHGLASAVVALFVAGLLIFIDPAAAGIGAASAATVYLVLTFAVRPLLRRNSANLVADGETRLRLVQEALGGLREIALHRSHQAIEGRFRKLDRRWRGAQALNAFLAHFAKYPVEAAGVTAVALVTLMMSRQPGGLVAAIPTLGALALGAQRLLPLLQHVYFGWSQTVGHADSFRAVIAEAGAPLPPLPARMAPPPDFEALEVEGVAFAHPGGPPLLRDVSFSLRRGEHLGIAGRSGSGKSTLADLVAGLLEPRQGSIRLNGRELDQFGRLAWQSAIAYVPQSVFIADDSIAANLAFPKAPDDLSPEELQEAIHAVELDDFVARLPHGLQTRLGERGVKISGGQRQRIAIARALLRRPSVLLLDEATSALDEAVEDAVLGRLMADPRLTLVIVTHRASILARCDAVIRVEDGTVAVSAWCPGGWRAIRDEAAPLRLAGR